MRSLADQDIRSGDSRLQLRRCGVGVDDENSAAFSWAPESLLNPQQGTPDCPARVLRAIGRVRGELLRESRTLLPYLGTSPFYRDRQRRSIGE